MTARQRIKEWFENEKASNIATGREQGRAEGRSEGRAEGRTRRRLALTSGSTPLELSPLRRRLAARSRG